jgi:L-alanine-DL-glutamate epimerase-like enolase superfamily enzyme
MRKSFFDYGPFLALETAVIDALSKTDKVPFSVILGGVHRNKVPVCGIVFLDAPQKMALTAQKCVSKGVRHLKVKVTGRNEVDFVNLKHIRQAIGYGPMIRIDANGAYKTVDRAIKAINDLNKYDISIVEQPLLWDNLDGLKELKRKVAPKIMVDESLRSPSDVALISKKKAADIVNFHPPKLGCLSLTRETIKRTVDLGLEYIIGSTVMTGIGVATHLHLAASMKNLHYPNEEIGLYEMFGTDVVMNPLRIVDGFMGIPRAYGIGVKIEEKKLKEYEINMNSLGALLRQTASRTYLRSPSLAKRAVRKALSPWLERYSKCLKNKRK